MCVLGVNDERNKSESFFLPLFFASLFGESKRNTFNRREKGNHQSRFVFRHKHARAFLREEEDDHRDRENAFGVPKTFLLSSESALFCVKRPKRER